MDVWYVGYGSNLFRERFICYISGGKFRWGGSYAKGCSDKTLPKENRPFIIPHGLFFAKNANSWGNGGVAFISPQLAKNTYTYGRMWKVTKEQFSEIRKQEGKSYDKKVYLGQDENGISIWTITSKSELTSNKPSDNYVKTIIAGLKETYHLSSETMSKYLIEKPGIKGNFKKKNLMAIYQSIRS